MDREELYRDENIQMRKLLWRTLDSLDGLMAVAELEGADRQEDYELRADIEDLLRDITEPKENGT